MNRIKMQEIECESNIMNRIQMVKKLVYDNYQQKLKAISDARKSDVADEEPSRELENEPQLLGEAKSAMQYVHDMKDKSDDLTLDDRVKMLNDDQR